MRRSRAFTVLMATGLTTAAVIGVSAVTASATVTTLYVGPANCSDAGSGQSAAQPFCTIAKAAAVAVAGQTVLVASGTYPGGATVANSGTPGAAITLTAAPGAQVTISGGSNGVAISGRHDVVVNGFSITATTSYGIAVRNSSAVTVSNNVVTLAGQPARGAVAAGIYLSAVSGSTVTGNRSERNSDHGIYLLGGTTGVVVSNNQANFNAEGFQRNANGINVISPGNTVIRNITHDNEDSGIQFYTGGDNNAAVLNVSYNNGDHGIDDLNVTGGRLVGNTIYHNCTTGINVEGTSGDYVVQNNIAVDNAVYPAYNGISCSRRAGNIGIWDSAPSSTVVDHNLVWLSKPGPMYVFGSAYSSLAALQSATGQERYGVQGDPRFASASAGDLRLGAGSPALDAGASAAPLEQSTDLLGNPRVDLPGVANSPDGGPRPFDDLGAYELQASTATVSPPSAALSLTPSSGQAPLAIQANANGSSDPQGQALSYAFDFGDGVSTSPSPAATASHTYSAAGAFTVKVTVTNASGLSATATAPVRVTGGAVASGNPGYVSQIATNYSTTSRTTQSVTVWRSGGVAAGDTAVVSLHLAGTAPGPVTGSDPRGNTYAVASDVADGLGNRLVVLYATLGSALQVNDRISVAFPSAATSRMVGDDLSGVTALDQAGSAAGAGPSFASGGGVTTVAAKEVLLAMVASDGGSAPAWGTGWTALTGYSAGTTYLGRGLRAPTATGSFAATGTVTGNWLATIVTFR